MDIGIIFNFNEGKKEFKATKNWAPSYPLFAYKDFKRNTNRQIKSLFNTLIFIKILF